MTHDVIIIGGGLGGLALSILLSKEGFHVLVLEKDDYPRHKVCGEYVSMKAGRFCSGSAFISMRWTCRALLASK